MILNHPTIDDIQVITVRTPPHLVFVLAEAETTETGFDGPHAVDVSTSLTNLDIIYKCMKTPQEKSSTSWG